MCVCVGVLVCWLSPIAHVRARAFPLSPFPLLCFLFFLSVSVWRDDRNDRWRATNRQSNHSSSPFSLFLILFHCVCVLFPNADMSWWSDVAEVVFEREIEHVGWVSLWSVVGIGVCLAVLYAMFRWVIRLPRGRPCPELRGTLFGHRYERVGDSFSHPLFFFFSSFFSFSFFFLFFAYSSTKGKEGGGGGSGGKGTDLGTVLGRD